MLYKHAWLELKIYIKENLPLLVGQEVIRRGLLEEMKQLEKRWKVKPVKSDGDSGEILPDAEAMSEEEDKDCGEEVEGEEKGMNLSIFDAVYCPKNDVIVTTKVCKKGKFYKPCPFYKGEKIRTGGLRELICEYRKRASK